MDLSVKPELFAKHSISSTPGRVTDTAEGAKAIAAEIRRPVMVKAQGQIGGRGKAGGVQAPRPKTYERTKNILGLDIKGHIVKRNCWSLRLAISPKVLPILPARPGQPPTWRCARWGRHGDRRGSGRKPR